MPCIDPIWPDMLGGFGASILLVVGSSSQDASHNHDYTAVKVDG